MGQKTLTQTNTIPGRSGQEDAILRLLQQVLKSSGGQLGDLSKLASGDMSALGPTGADRDIVARSIGAARDIAARNMETTTAEQQAQLGEVLGQRGIQGSSIESVQRAILQRDAQRAIMNNVDTAAQEGGQALLALPTQRAGIQIGANAELMNRLTGAGGLSLNAMLQERLAQSKQTTKEKGASWGELGSILQGGAMLGKAF